MINNNQTKLLSKMKNLIRNGKKRFENRSDRDYTLDLAFIGISIEEAWKHILSLNSNYSIYDYINNINTLIFIKTINGFKVYIKLKLEINKDNEEVVCISFHQSERGD